MQWKEAHIATECDVWLVECEKRGGRFVKLLKSPKASLEDEFRSGWFCPWVLYTYLKTSWRWKPCDVHE